MKSWLKIYEDKYEKEIGYLFELKERSKQIKY